MQLVSTALNDVLNMPQLSQKDKVHLYKFFCELAEKPDLVASIEQNGKAWLIQTLESTAVEHTSATVKRKSLPKTRVERDPMQTEFPAFFHAWKNALERFKTHVKNRFKTTDIVTQRPIFIELVRLLFKIVHLDLDEPDNRANPLDISFLLDQSSTLLIPAMCKSGYTVQKFKQFLLTFFRIATFVQPLTENGINSVQQLLKMFLECVLNSASRDEREKYLTELSEIIKRDKQYGPQKSSAGTKQETAATNSRKRKKTAVSDPQDRRVLDSEEEDDDTSHESRSADHLAAMHEEDCEDDRVVHQPFPRASVQMFGCSE